MHLCQGVGVKLTNEYCRYDTKQSIREDSVMQELWGIRSTPSLPSFQGPLKQLRFSNDWFGLVLWHIKHCSLCNVIFGFYINIKYRFKHRSFCYTESNDQTVLFLTIQLSMGLLLVVIYEGLYFDLAQGQMNGAPNETRTHSCRFARLTC